MIRRPPRSTQGVSSAASDVYKRQYQRRVHGNMSEQNFSITGSNPSKPSKKDYSSIEKSKMKSLNVSQDLDDSLTQKKRNVCGDFESNKEVQIYTTLSKKSADSSFETLQIPFREKQK
eukprot:TRINITY_DN25859_c0_g1_i2.p2 TRINITY_DN25859_c0_g1~~TRINITY_DN25859_c0_g1_i2.p2  ORF type:complete len:118 (+),score=32.05 TRINITY_DN25859_c0_g1_i2:133-486(+)